MQRRTLLSPVTLEAIELIKAAIVHMLTHLVNLASGLNQASKINFELWPGLGFKMMPIYNSSSCI